MIRRILAIAQRHAYVLQRSPHRLFDIVVWPVVDVVLFGSIGVFAAGRATGPARQVALYLLSPEGRTLTLRVLEPGQLLGLVAVALHAGQVQQHREAGGALDERSDR